MNFFFHELLMRERRDLAGEILTNAKPPVDDDVVYVHVSAEGTLDGACCGASSCAPIARSRSPARSRRPSPGRPRPRWSRSSRWCATAAAAAGLPEAGGDSPGAVPGDDHRAALRGSSGGLEADPAHDGARQAADDQHHQRPDSAACRRPGCPGRWRAARGGDAVRLAGERRRLQARRHSGLHEPGLTQTTRKPCERGTCGRAPRGNTDSPALAAP